MIALALLACHGDLPVESPDQDTSYVDPWDEDDHGRSCDILTQDCPDHKKCTVVPPQFSTGDWDERCVDLMDHRGEGKSCDLWNSGQDECRAGDWCFDEICRTFCSTSCAAVGLPGDVCVNVLPNAAVCLPTCDPFDHGACPVGEGCLFLGGSIFACLPVNHFSPDRSCASVSDCPPEYTCSKGACAPYCRISAPDCPDGTTCGPLSGDVGVCG